MITFQKTKFFLFITDKNILLLSWKNNLLTIKKEYEIYQVLSSPDILVNDIPTGKIDFMIVPDYWIGSKFYAVGSKRRSIIETFLSRKLSIDFPEVPYSKDFFEYLHYKMNTEEGITVYFIQEELFYKIYDAISLHLFIGKITAPAFLWQSKLSRQIREINKGQKLMVHIYPGGGYLCFFSKGLFLFSRVISRSHNDEYTSPLSYEIIQSLRLFSQKVKEEVEKIYIISEDEEGKNELAGLLDVKVEHISKRIDLSSPPLDLVKKLGSVAFLNKSDLSDSTKFFHIVPKQEKRLRRWALFQDVGIAIGSIIFLLMLMEAIFLPCLIPVQDIKETDSSYTSIEDYISAADDLIYHKNKIDPSFLILKIMDSLCKNISVDKINMESDPSIRLELNGSISALETNDIEKALSSFMKKLKHNIPDALLPSMEDVDIKRVRNGKFKFKFEFGITQE